MQAGATHPQHNSAYRQLRQELAGAGLFEPDTLGYALHCVWVIPAYALGWWLLLQVQDPLFRIGLAALVAFVMMQGAALGHEAGHGAVSRRRWVNSLAGFAFMSFGSGSSQASWQDMHEGHHRHANTGEDPNLRSSFLSFTEADAHAATGLRRLFTRHQPLLFWPMVSLMGVAFRLGSLRHMRARPRETRVEQALVLLHHLLWLALPIALIGWAPALINYLLVLWFCGVYLASIFVTNHLGAPAAATDGSFMARQAGNARNLKDSWLARRYFVGLNSHIEHHLFHRISFTKLHRARAATRRACEAQGIPYHEVGFFEALTEIRQLNRRMAKLAGRADSYTSLPLRTADQRE
jgi:fatty acid desaturase